MSDNDLVQKIRDRLRDVKDPTGGANALERVTDVSMDGSDAVVVLRVDASVTPEARRELEDLVRGAVEAIDGVGDCMVDVETREPKRESSSRGHGHGHGGGHEPPPKPPKGTEIPGVKKVLAVASGKGGVGKSTVAMNLALSLAKAGYRTGLLDADMHGPSLPTLLGIDAVRPTAVDGKLQPLKMHDLSVMSLGFLLDTSQPVIWRGPMISGAIKQLLMDVDWGGLDVLVVDLPPGTGDAQLTLVQTAKVDTAVIVTTPSDLALTDAQRGLQMFRAVNVPVLGIIENMSYFLCPHCGERTDVFGSGGGKRVADHLGVSLLGEIPLDTRVGQGNDSGNPVVLADPDSVASKVFASLADKAAAALELGASSVDYESGGAKKGLFSVLFGKSEDK